MMIDTHRRFLTAALCLLLGGCASLETTQSLDEPVIPSVASTLGESAEGRVVAVDSNDFGVNSPRGLDIQPPVVKLASDFLMGPSRNCLALFANRLMANGIYSVHLDLQNQNLKRPMLLLFSLKRLLIALNLMKTI